MAKKKSPSPQEDGLVEASANDKRTILASEDESTELRSSETGSSPESTSEGEQQNGGGPEGFGEDFPSDDPFPAESYRDDVTPADDSVDEAAAEDSDGSAGGSDAPSYGQLLHEVGTSTPLLVDGGQGPTLNALLGGDTLTSDAESLPDDVPEYAADGHGEDANDDQEATAPEVNQAAAPGDRSYHVLTIEARSRIQTEQDQQEIIWHELRNSHIAGRMLTGTLDGVEQTESGLTIAVVDYKGFRVAIPLKEMMLYDGPELHGAERSRLMDRLNRILVTMLGAEIDFIVRGIDQTSRSVVASRKAAMLRKRQTFYIDTNDLGETLIHEGRVAQARVVGVAEKVLRVEVFGVECPIFARDLSWTWFGDARDQYSVGDRVLVRVLTIDRKNLNDITITADVRSVSSSTSQENLKKIAVQCRYAGRVTDVRNGVVFIRLNNGVNAIAHTCYDRRSPGKKDDVSFAVTRVDEERGIALGIITRIIKQNL